MGRTTKTVTISLSPEILAEMEEVAREEGRTKSELLREGLRRYIAEREWMKAKEAGITEDQVEDIIDAYRQ